MNDNGLLSVDNGVDKIVDADASTLAREYYTSYSKYVLEYRALPSIEDGLKPVQRRIIYTANQFPQKLMKTAKVVGAVMAYHPHGDSSIAGALNDMAHPLNAFPIFTTKGNFGSVGFGASATRYTECYLSEAARFNFCQFIDYAEYESGEIGEQEPSALPCLVPYALFKGSEGIGIGLSTKVMPLDLIDLIDYYMDYIKRDGLPKKTIRPDIGYVLLEMDSNEIKEAVNNYKGKLTASSVVTQISDTTFLVEGLYGRSIDAVINRIDKYDHYFSQGKVGFRNASTSSMKYVFEIYDSSIDPKMFKEYLEWATRCNATFTRVMEDNGTAVYTKLNYVVQRSLECLNRAIDQKIEHELSKNKHQLTLYEVLRRCKELNLFKDITKMTADELVNLIVRSTDCEVEIAREIIRRPISYLTRSHSEEEDSLRSNIKALEEHDRKKYLISLYKELRKMILPYYESKKHSVRKDDLMENPCIKMEDGTIKVVDGDGTPFDNTVYFVSDAGYVYRRSISAMSSADIVVETSHQDRIVGFVTDKYKYLEIITDFEYDGWLGRIIVELEGLKDKQVVSLRPDDGEYINGVYGMTKVPKEYNSCIKSKVSKTTFFKNEAKKRKKKG